MAASGLLLPPASRPPPIAAPRLRGVPPPDPLGLRPLWPPGHGPRLLADQEEKRKGQAVPLFAFAIAR